MSLSRNKPIFILGCLLALIVGVYTTPQVSAAPGDVQYERETGESADSAAEAAAFPPALFPHWIHRINYRCDACHDDLFEMKRGGTTVTMDLMDDGEVCGACHNGQIAFASTFQTCHRCHIKTDQ